MIYFPRKIVKEFTVGKFYMLEPGIKEKSTDASHASDSIDIANVISVIKRKDSNSKLGHRIQAKSGTGLCRSLSNVTGNWYEISKDGFNYHVEKFKKVRESSHGESTNSAKLLIQ